jgi:hypothetical protein
LVTMLNKLSEIIMLFLKKYIGLWSNMRKKSERNYSFKSLSIRMMRMFGASFGSRRGFGSGLYVDSCIVRAALLPEGVGGNGSTEPSSGGGGSCRDRY